MRTPLNRRSLLLAILSVCAGRHAYALDRPRLIVLGAAVTSPIGAFGVGGAIAPKRKCLCGVGSCAMVRKPFDTTGNI
jgi:hypothetical protein